MAIEVKIFSAVNELAAHRFVEGARRVLRKEFPKLHQLLSGDVRDGAVPDEQVAHGVGTRRTGRFPLGHHLQPGLQGRDAGVSEYLVCEVAEEKPRIPQVEPRPSGERLETQAKSLSFFH